MITLAKMNNVWNHNSKAFDKQDIFSGLVKSNKPGSYKSRLMCSGNSFHVEVFATIETLGCHFIQGMLHEFISSLQPLFCSGLFCKHSSSCVWNTMTKTYTESYLHACIDISSKVYIGKFILISVLLFTNWNIIQSLYVTARTCILILIAITNKYHELLRLMSHLS